MFRFVDYALSRSGLPLTLCQICYDPLSLGLATAAITAGGTGLAFLGQKKAEKRAESAAAATPALQPLVTAPSEKSRDILAETDLQLGTLGSGRGREATNLTKKRRRTGTFLDDADPGADLSPSYTNTSLG